ncbi:AAA family ATPase (plasmid) [Synechococcus elongatus PCC 11801]|uniref:AAA family ATPase n=1 Tax=Synechococcus elongatus PCC 11801 TaxID=2219813 RepID=A0ACD5A375_SYNEL
MVSREFVVLDTEGTPTLREVAVFNHRGQLLYEARTPQEGDYYAADLARSLPEILRQLSSLMAGKIIVAHHADHDRQILLNSYAEVGLAAPEMQFECTYNLARSLHFGLESYNLGYLCDVLEVSPEPFSRDQAHQAAYDARYTYYLYRTLKRSQLAKTLAAGPSPFSSSRVDTPFQHFADDQAVYKDEYQRLKSVLRSISLDPNRQSKGAVIIGEPGTGKTHLMMRLAQDVLKQNRLLFIRQPTQESTILFHTYSRILESLVEPVGDDQHNQLDLLLIRSIRSIFAEIPEEKQTVGDREILEALDAEDLSSLGREDTGARRQRWERIESRLLTWWADRYSVSGYSRQILQGILRFCRYTDPSRRESCRRWLSSGELVPVDKELEGLSAWDSELLREEFSLQAIKILGELSCLDQPLIIVFDQLEGLWLEDNRPILLRFGEVVKELFTHVPNSLFILTLFPDRWQKFQQDFDGSIVGRVAQHTVYLQRPTADQLEEILNLRLQPLNVGALDLFTAEDLTEITQQRSIRTSLNCANEFYAYRVQGVPLPTSSPLLPTGGNLDTSAMANRLIRLEQQVQHLQTLIQKLLTSPVEGSSAVSQEVRVEVIEAIAQPVSVVSNSPYAPEFHHYCSYQRQTLQERWSGSRIINDSDDLGKLRQICQAFKQIKTLEISTLRLGRRVVPDNLVIRDQYGERCLAFLHLSNGNSILARLTNLNQMVLSHPKTTFILMRDRTVGNIRSPKASQTLEAFCNGTGDGRKRTHYQVLSLEQRVDLELVHQLVSDINNRDLEIPMPDALNLLVQQEPQNWIVKLVV